MSNLQITWSNHIAIVTISREKALNALNRQTMDELYEFFSVTAPATSGLKGVVITGAGEKSFVAGADITEFLGLTPDQGRELAQRGQGNLT